MYLNSSPPSAAYMRQWMGSALVQIMACRLFGAKPLPIYLNQWWLILNWALRNKFQWKSNQNTQLFIQKSVFKNAVCEMVAILSRARWVKHLLLSTFTPTNSDLLTVPSSEHTPSEVEGLLPLNATHTCLNHRLQAINFTPVNSANLSWTC